jgi:hypothetical protein
MLNCLPRFIQVTAIQKPRRYDTDDRLAEQTGSGLDRASYYDGQPAI